MPIRFKNLPVNIVGVGAYVPKKCISNEYIIRRGNLETTDEWIKDHAGIIERRVLDEGENNFTMAMEAAKLAIENTDISRKEIGLVVVGSETAEQYLPAVASMVRDDLGLAGVPAFDVNTACASFMTAFVQAALMIERGTVEKALVIGVDSLFEHQDPKDRDSAIIFGDGAGAVILSKSTHTPSGTAPGSPASDKARSPSRKGNIKEIVLSSVIGRGTITNPHGGYFRMERKQVVKNILELVSGNLLPESCETIDHFFFHQASKKVLGNIAGHLKIPIEKVYSTLWEYGNTGAASIPITLDQAVRLNKIKRGERVLLCGFGAGYEYGHVMMEW